MLKTSKKILSTIMVVIMILTAVPLSGFVGLELPVLDWGIKASALTESGRCGPTATYTFNSSTGELIISGTGAINKDAFRNNCEIKSLVISDGVTSIGYEAFGYCENLSNIIISNTVKIIDTQAFYNTAYYNNSKNWDKSLLYIGNHLVDAKYNLSTDCIIKDGTITIANNCFYACQLTSVSMPDSLKFIGDGAFQHCDNLESITIGDNVLVIGSYAFASCDNLKDVNLPSNLEIIDAGAFYSCINLKSITIPESVIEINDNAFSNCSSLETINFPENLKYIGDSILSNTAWFNYRGKGLIVYDDWVYGYKGDMPQNYIVAIDKNIKGVASCSFVGDSNVSEFNVVSDNENLSSVDGVLFNKDKTVLMQYPKGKYGTDYIIPDTVEEIYPYAFYNCYISNITIGKNLKKIGYGAFYYYSSYFNRNVYVDDLEQWCKIEFESELSNPLYTYHSSYSAYLNVNGVKLSEFEIPNTISEIKQYTFSYCDNLISVDIPLSITSINKYAFHNCINLKNVFYPGSQENWNLVDKGDEYNLVYVDLYLMHKHNYSVSVINEPTCTQTGIARYECSLGDTKTEILPALGHTWDEGKITSNSTCSNGGTKTYTCTVCFDTKTESIATLNHDYQLSYSIDPTCTKDGYAVYQCTQCPSTDIRTTEAMLGHDWQIEFTIDIDSTCTKTGIKSKHCNRCSETTDETIVETKEHSWQAQQTITKTPTCIAEGEAAILCKDCKVVKTGSTVTIEPLGHNASEQEFTIDVAATCQSTGRMSKHCTRCNYTEQATIIPTATHDYHIASSSTATCYEGGKAIYVCDGCGDWYIVENSDALGHDYDYLIVESSTCKREGIKTGVCIRCGDTDTRSVDKIDHDYVRTEVSPTCIDDGLATYTCSYGCGTTYDETLPALGHSYPANWTILMKSTCTERGLSVKICKACTEIMSQTLPKLAHEDANNDGICDECGFGESSKPDTPSEPEVHKHSYTSTVTKAPTCTESGIVKFACNCGDTYNEYPAALGHSDADGNGLCDVCGYGDAIKPDVPEDPSANCSCNCHKSGLSKILFNIILFFQKLLRSNKTCICGASHY